MFQIAIIPTRTLQGNIQGRTSHLFWYCIFFRGGGRKPQLSFAEIPWRYEEAIIYGKKIMRKRMVAWYGNENFTYTYSKIPRRALPWTDKLLELKAKAGSLSRGKYISCLMNLYSTANDGRLALR